MDGKWELVEILNWLWSNLVFQSCLYFLLVKRQSFIFCMFVCKFEEWLCYRVMLWSCLMLFNSTLIMSVNGILLSHSKLLQYLPSYTSKDLALSKAKYIFVGHTEHCMLLQWGLLVRPSLKAMYFIPQMAFILASTMLYVYIPDWRSVSML